jgi:hypothetical protein
LDKSDEPEQDHHTGKEKRKLALTHEVNVGLPENL